MVARRRSRSSPWHPAGLFGLRPGRARTDPRKRTSATAYGTSRLRTTATPILGLRGLRDPRAGDVRASDWTSTPRSSLTHRPGAVQGRGPEGAKDKNPLRRPGTGRGEARAELAPVPGSFRPHDTIGTGDGAAHEKDGNLAQDVVVRLDAPLAGSSARILLAALVTQRGSLVGPVMTPDELAPDAHGRPPRSRRSAINRTRWATAWAFGPCWSPSLSRICPSTESNRVDTDPLDAADGVPTTACKRRTTSPLRWLLVDHRPRCFDPSTAHDCTTAPVSACAS